VQKFLIPQIKEFNSKNSHTLQTTPTEACREQYSHHQNFNISSTTFSKQKKHFSSSCVRLDPVWYYFKDEEGNCPPLQKSNASVECIYCKKKNGIFSDKIAGSTCFKNKKVEFHCVLNFHPDFLGSYLTYSREHNIFQQVGN